jgi:hypothetical protein
MSNDTHVSVEGIVAARNKEPYVRLTVNGEQAQLSMAEAQKIAKDLLVMAAWTEADAMVLKFFDKKDFPDGAGAALMREFRDYRKAHDAQPVRQKKVDSESGETIR